MKNTEITVGKKYMLSLGRSGAVAVTITQKTGTPDGAHWNAVDSRGRFYEVTARRLSPCPVTDRTGNLLGHAHQL